LYQDQLLYPLASQYPRSRNGKNLSFEPIEAPDFKDYFISLENIIEKYEKLVTNKIRATGTGMLKDIVVDLDTIDSIRCFFAVLFLARDQKVDLEQIEDDIKITLIKEKFTK